MNMTMLKRILLLIPAILLEILIIILFETVLYPMAIPVVLVLHILGFIFTIYIITKEDEGVYKILWILVITVFPALGALGYLLFGDKKTGKPLKKAIEQSRAALPVMEKHTTELCNAYKVEDKRAMQTLETMELASGYPIHENIDAKYYPLGDDVFEDMLTELNSAEKFIYIEYFIVENGLLWNSITDILERKVKEGVDVRVIYDDLGSIGTFSKKDRRALQQKGIKCIAFNKIVFVLGTLNYRSHRKMMIIDGRVAFSGGINMADEYINQNKHPYGHWKDLAYRITGGAVNNFTHMFAEFWNGFSNDKINPSLLEYKIPQKHEHDGLVLSYYDSPLDEFNLSNSLFIDYLAQATDYVWFYTPYLLLGDSLLNALCSAAQRGVDVRIIMPGIPDKKMVFRMAHSYYPYLLNAGVKIYEYTPGFVHAKGCIVDDKFCSIGTVNLDYRSLFLHFENSTVFYKSSIIQDFKNDYLATQEKCRFIQLSDCKITFWKWLLDGLLRIIAPLF